MDVTPQRKGWKSYKFNIHDFAAIDATKGKCFRTPEFSCNGHRWCLQIYPGGRNGSATQARDGNIIIYLPNLSNGGISATYEMKILNKFGGVYWKATEGTFFYPPDGTKAPGWSNFCTRSDIRDQNILDADGTLAVVISMKEEGLKPFIPKNPCQHML